MEPTPYQEHPIRNPSVTEILPDDRRRFVVVSGFRSGVDEPWTLVLECRGDYWISRRELLGAFAPEAAVSGYLFDREGAEDPVDLLRGMNELVRAEYYRILEEKMKGDRARSELTSELTRLRAQVERLRGGAAARRTARRKAASPRRRPSS